MQDYEIVDLYWARSENAITQTNVKYGSYCRKIAMNIVADNEDSEECINDTYLSAWNSMPEERPDMLAPYLAAIIRNHALTLYRKKHSQKRGAGQTALALDELFEVAGNSSTEDIVDMSLLSSHINGFLSGLKADDRIVFVRRYFYVDSLADIAAELSMSESAVKSLLFRLRQKLKDHLVQEGYEL
ncbi:MAG: sigma-70 family RNA polymerase sigma factor [Lachnospiraceae bacterium]|nr:sigma-70 family RNA polymerase sigma factor [Lachnospiraceae bacterium]